MTRNIAERRAAGKAPKSTNRRGGYKPGGLYDSYDQIMQQERLRVLGAMASGVAHDFNNILMPILGYTDLLLNHPEMLDNREELIRFIAEMNTAARDGVEVVRRMGELYRHSEDVRVMKAVDLNKVIEAAIAVTRLKWRDMAQSNGIDIRIETELSSNLPVVAGEESSLRTALVNLILNSVDAMPRGGTLAMSTAPRGTMVEVRVADTGTGMTEDVCQRATELFFTTKAEGGNGLGLAMVQAIIEQHRGEMDIKTELGKGTTIFVLLPVVKPGDEAVKSAAGNGWVKGCHVLVVDDDQLVCNLIAAYLTISGNDVETAKDGKNALEKFEAGDFDVVVTDKRLPDMNGDQLAAAIKGQAPDVPIVMMTGLGEAMDLGSKRPRHIDVVVNKPLTEHDLQRAMSQALHLESRDRAGSP